VNQRYRVAVDGRPIEEPGGWEVTWLDRAAGVARLTRGERALTVLVEGAGSEWFVTLAGRRVPVAVRTHREQLIAEAEVVASHRGGPIDVRASLPGLIVAVSAAPGDEVAEGDPLVTIEAMKMQNEVRAPHAGRVASVAVEPGRTVATGEVLLRIE
jgi:biotin carboxyl carrier protein